MKRFHGRRDGDCYHGLKNMRQNKRNTGTLYEQAAGYYLEQQGYIYPVKGRGNFVSGNAGLKKRKQESVFQELKGLVEKSKELEIDRDTFMKKAKEFYDLPYEQDEDRFKQEGE